VFCTVSSPDSSSLLVVRDSRVLYCLLSRQFFIACSEGQSCSVLSPEFFIACSEGKVRGVEG